MTLNLFTYLTRKYICQYTDRYCSFNCAKDTQDVESASQNLTLQTQITTGAVNFFFGESKA